MVRRSPLTFGAHSLINFHHRSLSYLSFYHHQSLLLSTPVRHSRIPSVDLVLVVTALERKVRTIRVNRVKIAHL